MRTTFRAAAATFFALTTCACSAGSDATTERAGETALASTAPVGLHSSFLLGFVVVPTSRGMRCGPRAGTLQDALIGLWNSIEIVDELGNPFLSVTMSGPPLAPPIDVGPWEPGLDVPPLNGCFYDDRSKMAGFTSGGTVHEVYASVENRSILQPSKCVKCPLPK